MKVSDFHYELPREAIAQTPHTPRDQCKLLVMENNGIIRHRIFNRIIDYLRPRDVIVVNTTRVIPARLHGRKEQTNGKVELFLLFRQTAEQWECLVRPLHRMRQDMRIVFSGSGLVGRILEKKTRTCIVEFSAPGDVVAEIYRVGQVPLPPYIRRTQGPTCADAKEYQTVYASDAGAVAAPTAGLHFTQELLDRISERGTRVATVLLHTSWASFFSLTEPELELNHLPAEYYQVTATAAKIINECKQSGGKVFAVGTTTVRALETSGKDGTVQPGDGWTDLFIYPGYSFRIVDALITNFHIPSSSLLVLTSSFAGRDRLMEAYKEALRKGYRFLSYGDAMLIF